MTSTQPPNHLISTQALKQIQAISGLGFGSFLSMHLLTTLSANSGPFAYNEALRLFRTVYQNSVFEIVVLFGSLTVHALSSSILYFRPHIDKPLLINKIHKYTGYFLASVVFAHAAATRLPSVMWGPEYLEDFSGIKYTLEYFTVAFAGYYAALGIAGFNHLVIGSLSALARFGVVSPSILIKANQSKFYWIGMGLTSVAIVSAIFRFWAHPYELGRREFWVEAMERSHHAVGL